MALGRAGERIKRGQVATSGFADSESPDLGIYANAKGPRWTAACDGTGRRRRPVPIDRCGLVAGSPAPIRLVLEALTVRDVLEVLAVRTHRREPDVEVAVVEEEAVQEHDLGSIR
jgi:hypothetical protein